MNVRPWVFRAFGAAWKWFYGTSWLKIAIQVLSVVFLASASQLGVAAPTSPWFWRLFFIGVALAVLGGVQLIAAGVHARRIKDELGDARTRIEHLEHDLDTSERRADDAKAETADLEDRFRDFRERARDDAHRLLESVCTQYGFTDTERVTIYRRTTAGQRMIARHSMNLKYQQVSASNRTRFFEDSYGLIGRVSQTNARVTNLQGPTTDDQVKYRKWQKKCGLLLKKARDIGMQSRSYDVVSLDEPNGRIVVAIESTEGEAVNIVPLGDAIEAGQWPASAVRHIVRLLADLPGNEKWKEELHG